MRKTTIVAWAVALSLSVIAGAQSKTADEQVPALSSLSGAYKYVGDRDKDAQTIKEEIDNAISNMIGFIKRKARSKLEGVNSIIQTVRISTKDQYVTVVLDDFTVTAPTDGSKRPIKTPNGESAQAFFHVESASLIQEIEQTRATRKNTFRFDKAGKLVMTVQETSSRLDSPVRYDLVYAPASK